jgi:hypothetical protein
MSRKKRTDDEMMKQPLLLMMHPPLISNPNGIHTESPCSFWNKMNVDDIMLSIKIEMLTMTIAPYAEEELCIRKDPDRFIDIEWCGTKLLHSWDD